MEKAIEGKYECPSCGNVLTKQDVIKRAANGLKYSFEGPKRCACGITYGFKLLTFEPATATIKKDSEVSEE